jgi:hypothetical protein
MCERVYHYHYAPPARRRFRLARVGPSFCGGLVTFVAQALLVERAPDVLPQQRSCQYLYVGTSKASKLSSCGRASASAAGECHSTYYFVQHRLLCPAQFNDRMLTKHPLCSPSARACLLRGELTHTHTHTHTHAHIHNSICMGAHRSEAALALYSHTAQFTLHECSKDSDECVCVCLCVFVYV